MIILTDKASKNKFIKSHNHTNDITDVTGSFKNKIEVGNSKLVSNSSITARNIIEHSSHKKNDFSNSSHKMISKKSPISDRARVSKSKNKNKTISRIKKDSLNTKKAISYKNYSKLLNLNSQNKSPIINKELINENNNNIINSKDNDIIKKESSHKKLVKRKRKISFEDNVLSPKFKELVRTRNPLIKKRNYILTRKKIKKVNRSSLRKINNLIRSARKINNIVRSTYQYNNTNKENSSTISETHIRQLIKSPGVTYRMSKKGIQMVRGSAQAIHKVRLVLSKASNYTFKSNPNIFNKLKIVESSSTSNVIQSKTSGLNVTRRLNINTNNSIKKITSCSQAQNISKPSLKIVQKNLRKKMQCKQSIQAIQSEAATLKHVISLATSKKLTSTVTKLVTSSILIVVLIAGLIIVSVTAPLAILTSISFREKQNNDITKICEHISELDVDILCEALQREKDFVKDHINKNERYVVHESIVTPETNYVDLISYINAYYDEIEYNNEIKTFLDELHKQLYTLTITEWTEIYEELEVTYDSKGNKHITTKTFPEYHIEIILEAKDLHSYIKDGGLPLDESQESMYDIYREHGTTMITEISNPFSEPIPISSRYGYRISPLTDPSNLDEQIKTELHAGIDIPLDAGTPIKAAMSGTAKVYNNPGGYGNYVVIETFSRRTLYAHCSIILVQDGQKVFEGMEIARVGSTGASTGPHLHFEYSEKKHFWSSFERKNPQFFLPPGSILP